ncbi:MAG: hypothetical protein Q9168_000090 [Polycauliona sp. 1 TL-2023]
MAAADEDTTAASLAGTSSKCDLPPASGGQSSQPKHHPHANHILLQVRDWLHQEKARKLKRKFKGHGEHGEHASAAGLVKRLVDHRHSDGHRHNSTYHQRQSSDLSEDDSLALEKLEKILSTNLQLDDDNEIVSGGRKASIATRKGSIRRSLRKKSTGVSSDTDYQDGDMLVPSADVILDNSKTLSYTGGAESTEGDPVGSSKKSKKEKEAWIHFKNEIVRLTHTLKCKGWRRVPLAGADIGVERLSGALTNAVYVVEHLIDRDNELQILRRLARKRIGPRMLGTFTNGRFEEFFNAQTLTAKDLRIPETSKQIAKRMRELHEGIELLQDERDAGSFVWRNWDSWVGRCGDVISWLDGKIIAGQQGTGVKGTNAWKQRGLVCGVEWPVFRKTVERYRTWLDDQCGGSDAVKDRLVFAHNDTQYGNLLRLKPSGESPLLIPANEHKQLIVIDFEYASANVPGLEFANHFTEWCYNYHIANSSYVLHERGFPRVEEQHRFLKAYVEHRPFRPSLSTQSSTASLRPMLSHSVSNFMLDSRAPPAQLAEEEKGRDDRVEDEIRRLMHEARIWRPANSAMWVAWGIVQAKVEGMDEALKAKKTVEAEEIVSEGKQAGPNTLKANSKEDGTEAAKEGLVEAVEADDGEEDGFDYLGYAQERAMFFWGDMLQMGLVGKEELPEEVRAKAKVVEY